MNNPIASPLISVAELSGLMKEPSLVLLDARTGAGVREKYAAGHIEAARFIDLDRDLARHTTNPADGGRHPLPDIKAFASLLGQLGITPSSRVVVYDDKGGANAAARCWWMIRSIGHEHVQVLDGGYQAAMNAGLPISSLIPTVAEQPAYPFSTWQYTTVDADTVANAVNDPAWVVIDVREPARYRGDTEPIDTVAGHIPGAVNMPFAGNLDANDQFLPPEQLAGKYHSIVGDRDPEHIVVHCGSGVTACHSILAMEAAGMKTPSLYVGSWSEWSRNERPVAKGA